MKISSAHFAGKQPGMEDKKGSCTKPQSTPDGSDGVEGFASSAAAASTPVLGSGMWDPWSTHPPGCVRTPGWGCCLMCSQFPPMASQGTLKFSSPCFLRLPVPQQNVSLDNWNYSGDLMGLRRHAVRRLRCICVL